VADESPANPRVQLLLVVFSAAWGIYFFHALADLSWVKAVTLSILASAGYLVEPTTPRKTAVLATLVGAFLGLGAWWAVDLGPLSLLVGLGGAGLLLVYVRIAGKRR
jgi:hypothetical protein